MALGMLPTTMRIAATRMVARPAPSPSSLAPSRRNAVVKIHARRTTFDSPSAGFLGSLVTVQFVCRREATMRRSTLATALVAVFISYLATPAAVKTGGYVRTDRVVNKSPLIDKNGISHTGQVQDPNLVNPTSSILRAASFLARCASPFPKIPRIPGPKGLELG